MLKEISNCGRGVQLVFDDVLEAQKEYERLVVGYDYSLGCKAGNPTEEKEQAMRGYNDNLSVNPTVVTNIEAVDHQERDARCHLNGRLYNIVDKKDYDLQKQFNLRNDPYPHDPEDMVQRIKDGKYVIEKSELFGKHIIWRDPKAEPDQKGYDEAYKKLYASRQKVEDDIAVKYPEDALESLREFEGITFS